MRPVQSTHKKIEASAARAASIRISIMLNQHAIWTSLHACDTRHLSPHDRHSMRYTHASVSMHGGDLHFAQRIGPLTASQPPVYSVGRFNIACAASRGDHQIAKSSPPR
jgi:hypothetical protein